MKRELSVHMTRRRTRGAVAVMYAMLLVPIIGFVGLAVDLSFAYTRRTELQSVADAAAVAAARALNGTVQGIEDAKDSARKIAERHSYSVGTPVVWDDDALRFSDSPAAAAADWLPASAVTAANVDRMFYTRVDTGELGEEYGRIEAVFTRVVGATTAIALKAIAVAGRTSSLITPLAVCAITNTAVTSRDVVKGGGVVEKELLEHGFRRGVSYNLLNLNPHAATAAHYLVNPLDFPDKPDSPAHRTLPVVKPFVCNGTITAPHLRSGSRVYVGAGFSSSLITELNSRFSDYTGGSSCNNIVAPPDANIKPFHISYFAWWMNSTGTISGSALPHIQGSSLLTIADRASVATGVNKASYGPLWAFSKAVHYDSAAPGGVGTPFVKADWPFLYPVATGGPVMSNYPDSAASPYNSNNVDHRALPPVTGVARRRVLNIPLLECPVGGSTATVLAIGRFFMTAPADAAIPAVHGEFGGLATAAELRGSVGIYR